MILGTNHREDINYLMHNEFRIKNYLSLNVLYSGFCYNFFYSIFMFFYIISKISNQANPSATTAVFIYLNLYKYYDVN